jgi:cytochrome P450
VAPYAADVLDLDPVPLVDLPWFDLFADLSATDPFGALDARRVEAPVWRSDLGVHVMGYHPALALLRDDRLHRGVPQMLDGAGITDPVVRRQWLTAMLGSAPADHDRMRRLVSPSFTPRAIADLRDCASAVAEQGAERGIGAGTIDAMGSLAVEIPPAVFCRMIGAPDADAPMIGRLSAEILQIFAREPSLGPSIEASTHELVEYVLGFVEERRRAPRSGDLVSNLLAAEEGGERLTTDELVALVIEVLEASTDNTSSQLALVLHAAAREPGRWEALRAEPASIPAFVEEASRLWPRITGVAKSTDVDLDVAGVSVPAGTTVFAMVPSAHRDPAAFPDPLRFDPARTGKGVNLNYGSGSHYCIGANLARLEMGAALEVLTRRWATVEPAGPLELDVNPGVVTVTSLPLAVTPG